jgi:hypothetical protein
MVSGYYLIYRFSSLQISSVALLSISVSRSNPRSSLSEQHGGSREAPYHLEIIL